MKTSIVNNYLKSIHKLCSDEVSNERMSDYFKNLSEKYQSICYDNFILWFIFADSIILIAILYYLYGNTVPEYLLSGFIVSLICAEIIHTRYEQINQLNKNLENLYEKNFLNVKPVPLKTNLYSMFLEFTRGNYDNKIERVSRAKDNSFELIRYHWVTKNYLSESKTNKYNVQYDDFYRDCIVFETNIYDNIWVQSLSIYDGGITWNTTYERFNKKFKIKCNRELAAAKVLTPPIVLHIDEMSNIINDLNLEFRNNGVLLISMADGSLRTNVRISVDNLSEVAKTFGTGKNHTLELILKLKELLKK
jgi:hypothetical protein